MRVGYDGLVDEERRALVWRIPLGSKAAGTEGLRTGREGERAMRTSSYDQRKVSVPQKPGRREAMARPADLRVKRWRGRVGRIDSMAGTQVRAAKRHRRKETPGRKAPNGGVEVGQNMEDPPNDWSRAVHVPDSHGVDLDINSEGPCSRTGRGERTQSAL